MVPRGLVCFDVDGALVPRASSSQYPTGFLGHLVELTEAEQPYAAGSLSNRAVSLIDAKGWRGRAPSEVAAWLDALPLVDGIAEAVAWGKRRDLMPILTTVAWEPVGSFLCQRFGLAVA